LPEPKKNTVDERYKDSVKARRGELAEVLVADRLAVLGWYVLRPVIANPKVDLYAVKKERLLRIQVKHIIRDKLNIRVGRRHRPWITIRDDVDFLIIVLPSDDSLAAMYNAEYYVIPSATIQDFREVFFHNLPQFRNNWDVLDKYAALADEIDVVASEDDSRYAEFTFVPPGKIVSEITFADEKVEIIVANCARTKRDWYAKYGEEVFVHYFVKRIIEAVIHGLIHLVDWQANQTRTIPHKSVSQMAWRLAWE